MQSYMAGASSRHAVPARGNLHNTTKGHYDVVERLHSSNRAHSTRIRGDWKTKLHHNCYKKLNDESCFFSTSFTNSRWDGVKYFATTFIYLFSIKQLFNLNLQAVQGTNPTLVSALQAKHLRSAPSRIPRDIYLSPIGRYPGEAHVISLH